MQDAALCRPWTLAALLKQTGGDGFNGDTMGSIPRSFWAVALQDSYPIAFEPEDGGTDASLNWATMGWGYWLYGTHTCRRWTASSISRAASS